ncbi:unnamed protein product [Phytophthora fragariaefolia]|uniref:Unnamed protein product n=1 Tax=Phytophthora fragariaefolia TaxID=1490495 RepID=A0A9W7D943_9STRA|nr:unnamed protein product [Phytophthora fragariaefolia]
MKLYSQNNPTKKTSLIATFTAHYGDKGLAKIVEGAKLDKRTAFTAKRVQTEQIQRWLVDGKTPDDVFALLKLDEAGVQLFKQPQVNTWVKYMDDFKMANPDVETTLFTDLSGRFTEQTLVHMLIAAKKVPSTESVAVRIQAEQTNLWLDTERKPGDLLVLLGLDKQGVSLINIPLFSDWVKYTDEFNKIYFGKRLTVISALTKHYSVDVIAKMILAASHPPSTSNLAKRLYNELLRNWSTNKLLPEHVFVLLKLHEAPDKLLSRPFYTVWLRYLLHYRDANPKLEVTLLSELTKVYKDNSLSRMLFAAEQVPETKNLAVKLMSQLLGSWVSANTDPVRVFYLLGSPSKGKTLPYRLYQNYRASYKQPKQ